MLVTYGILRIPPKWSAIFLHSWPSTGSSVTNCRFSLFIGWTWRPTRNSTQNLCGHCIGLPGSVIMAAFPLSATHCLPELSWASLLLLAKLIACSNLPFLLLLLPSHGPGAMHSTCGSQFLPYIQGVNVPIYPQSFPYHTPTARSGTTTRWPVSDESVDFGESPVSDEPVIFGELFGHYNRLRS